MPGQCVVAVGAEDDWRVRASGRDEGMNTFPQGGTWTADENWRVNGNAGTGTFLLRVERRVATEMRICTDGNVGIGRLGNRVKIAFVV